MSMLQMDFDCPNGRRGEYAVFIDLKAQTVAISDWPGGPHGAPSKEIYELLARKVYWELLRRFFIQPNEVKWLHFDHHKNWARVQMRWVGFHYAKPSAWEPCAAYSYSFQPRA